MEKPIIIFGAGSLARSVLAILRSHDFDVYGFLDDDADGDQIIDDVPVLGKTNDQGYLKLIGRKAEAVVAFEDIELRKSSAKYLIETRKVMPMNAIHARAVLPENRSMGHGNIIGANAIIEPGVSIGSHSVVMPSAYLGTNAKIGDFDVIGAGALINAECQLGDRVFVGSGVNIVSGVRIEDDVNIGAGSLVIEHIIKGKTVFGNPAQEVK